MRNIFRTRNRSNAHGPVPPTSPSVSSISPAEAEGLVLSVSTTLVEAAALIHTFAERQREMGQKLIASCDDYDQTAKSMVDEAERLLAALALAKKEGAPVK